MRSISVPRIVVAISENEDSYADSSRHYHLSIQVSNSPVARLHPEIIEEIGANHYHKELGDFGFSLMQDLFRTQFVREMYMMTHSISIYRELQIPWEKVHHAVLEVLKKRFSDPTRITILELPRKKILPEHYHDEDSDRPGFHMPQ